MDLTVCVHVYVCVYIYIYIYIYIYTYIHTHTSTYLHIHTRHEGKNMMVYLCHSLTPIGEHLSTNFSNCDLAVPGSPSINKFISPLRVKPSGNLTKTVPCLLERWQKHTRWEEEACFLTSSWSPQTEDTLWLSSGHRCRRWTGPESERGSHRRRERKPEPSTPLPPEEKLN